MTELKFDGLMFLDDSLAYNFHKLYFLLRSKVTKSLEQYKLSPEQWHVIAVMHFSQKHIAQKDICIMLQKERHTISKLVNKMVSNGWLGRDGRSLYIHPDKINLIPEIKSVVNQSLAEILPNENRRSLLLECKKILKLAEATAEV
jgi:hypothetical protein